MFLTVYDSYVAHLQPPAVRPHIPVGEHIHELDKFGNHRVEFVGWKHKHTKTDLFQTVLVVKPLQV